VSAQIGSARGKRYFLKAAKQTTGIATINRTQLSSFPVLLPPIEIQERYRQVRSKIGELETTLTRASAEADRLFEALSQRAFGPPLPVKRVRL
jgi:type I restriction enzyme S subunit